MEATAKKKPILRPDSTKTRRAMDAAERLADGDRVSYEAVRLAAGYTRTQMCEMVSRKRKQGEWRWSDSDPVPTLQDKFEVPGERERIRQEWTANMLRETRHAPDKPPEQTPAEACRVYLREWRKARKARLRSEWASSAPTGSSSRGAPGSTATTSARALAGSR